MVHGGGEQVDKGASRQLEDSKPSFNLGVVFLWCVWGLVYLYFVPLGYQQQETI